MRISQLWCCRQPLAILDSSCSTPSLPRSLPVSLGSLLMRTPVTGFRTTLNQSDPSYLGYLCKDPTQRFQADVNFRDPSSVTAGWLGDGGPWSLWGVLRE